MAASGLGDAWHAVSARFADRDQPADAGRLLLLLSGLVVVFCSPLLKPTDEQWVGIAAVTVAMALLLAGSWWVPWHRLPRRAALAFPIAVFAGLGALGVATQGLAASYTGVFMLCFAYIGWSQPGRTSLAVLPPALVAYVAAYGGWTTPLVVRLVIVVLVWVLLAEVLAGFMARQVELTAELRAIAHTDSLTGIDNRRGLDARLSSAQPGDTVIVCDLDHFKSHNDSFGHAAGDRALTDFGLAVRLCLRSADYAARYGGEEFVLLLPATTEAQAGGVLNRLRTTWAAQGHGLTFSAGVARHTTGRSVAGTISAADGALYRAKAAGRNRDEIASVVLQSA
jgi:diguanylate cyclase (GGDEF)-like protein